MKATLMSLGLVLPSAAQIANPVIWADFADLDIFRVDDTFYYSASNMHYSPGAPILRSWDLINWQFLGHSIPELSFGPEYYLEGGGNAYIAGTWASTMRYRESTGTFHWMGCIGGVTYVYTAPDAAGPWGQASTIPSCYYDAGMLVSSNDTLYVAYGNNGITVAELSPDGLSEARSQVVYPNDDDAGYLEGSRFYEPDGIFYIFLRRLLISDAGTPVESCGYPHQGGIVDTANGDWYYMAFVDCYPAGRVPVLAPITWADDGWPFVDLVDGALWRETYDAPNIEPPQTPINEFEPGTDLFMGPALSPHWEWNHNPDNSKWAFRSNGDGDGGLTLHTASVTDDLYTAKNTLTRRILGPASAGTLHLSSLSCMADGDRAGLSLLRQSSAWIGIVNQGGTNRISVTTGLEMGTDWDTISTGSELASAPLVGGDQVWLRADAAVGPGTVKTGQFSYSLDGVEFVELGGSVALNSTWEFFMGYRFGIFNYATAELGGSVDVVSFDIAMLATD
ncbi:glycosyl hydrolase [Aspergillus keveii]|uniref:Glycosyl hydrolase n=1 Tax=Aspergillus keveii TaxID=714993 RepID=A0ABR4GKT2_9EURO